MREMMDGMHGEGSFDEMKARMEERWGRGALETMHENCGQGGAGHMNGGGMMGGGGRGMMGGR
jgi:hypothetical protein